MIPYAILQDTVCDSAVFRMTAHDICANSVHDLYVNNNNNNNRLYFERVTHLVTKLIFHEAL